MYSSFVPFEFCIVLFRNRLLLFFTEGKRSELPLEVAAIVRVPLLVVLRVVLYSYLDSSKPLLAINPTTKTPNPTVTNPPNLTACSTPEPRSATVSSKIGDAKKPL